MDIVSEKGKGGEQVKPLALYVLGPFHLTRQGMPITAFRSDKVRALLVYLVLEHDRPHRRDELAGLLWPEMSDEAARRNLRLSLHRLRQTLGDDEKSAFFDLTRDTVQCRLETIWVDALAFEEMLMAVQRHPHEAVERCDACAEHLTRAVDLYRGDFLQGFLLKDTLPFSEWVAMRRERWHYLAVKALFWLSEYHRCHGRFDDARRYAQRQLELEPWREEAHRQIMDVLARLGDVSAALAQYETCCRVLAEEFGVAPDEQTLRLYRRIRQMRRAPSPPLPTRFTSFVGRKRELAWLGERLNDPHTRLVTITGPPGVGKTRLALEAAATHAAAFLNGVCFVPLADVHTPERLEEVLAEGLGCDGGQRGTAHEQVLRFLREREMLLILDNFEGLLAAPEDRRRKVVRILEDIAKHASAVKVLVTSREPLHLSWEWVLRLEGLRCAPETAQVDEVDVLTSPAGRLFTERARQAQWGFDPQQEAVHIAHICRLVEGLPLGLELAAAWLDRLSCREIADRLQYHLDFLVAPFQDVEERHRSLRAAFESSWQLLSSDQQRALRRLAVFAGEFTVGAAREVAGVPAAVLEVLADKSLLHRPASGRYGMHEMVRAFAREKLHAVPDEAEDIARRHSRYYAHLLHARVNDLRGARQGQALDEIRQEWPDVRAAWAWAAGHRDEETVLAALEGLYHFLELSGRFREGAEMFAQAIESLSQAGLFDGQETFERLWVRLLVRYGWFMWRLCRYREAQEVLHQGVELARRWQETQEEAFALGALGLVLHNTGEYQLARRYYERSLDLYRSNGDLWGIGRALSRYGLLLYTLGEWEQARDLFEEGVRIAKQTGEQRGMAFFWAYLGLVNCDLGRHEIAVEQCETALERCRQTGDEYGVALSLAYLGRALSHLGQHARARQVLEEALDHFRELGDDHAVAYTMTQLGEACRLAGNANAARQWHKRSLDAYRAVKSYGGMAEALGYLGHLAFTQGQPGKARYYFHQSFGLLAHHPDAQPRLAQFARRWAKAWQSLRYTPFATVWQTQGRFTLHHELKNTNSARK